MINSYKIDTDIYNEDCIRQAIEDFEEVAEIKLQNNEISITGDDTKETDEIFSELCNYIIGIQV